MLGSILTNYYPLPWEKYSPINEEWKNKDLFKEYEELFKNFDFNSYTTSRTNFSILNKENKDDSIYYEILCYGIEKEELELKIEKDLLIIESKEKTKKSTAKYSLKLNIDGYEVAETKAELKNGVLKLSIPRKQNTIVSKKIKID